ncbi:unnamed protein product [Rotaria socialis]|uniref:Peptidase M28 domain-containing protein n=1 Tax=Rotaria socialis TaxID=392032 RepID=A0A821I179_9BILA|nr:unnamed protein product [Rotaria socialis]CAF4695333.1 unnamed protein product [Rotaria socialis]
MQLEIGRHSDSMTAGPGINDNVIWWQGLFIYPLIGSGTAANLALAVALAHLFQTINYSKYSYRIRFCWWGAEELGLLGSTYHITQAQNSTIAGERISDYLINLNFDMLRSPNYICGIYDGSTIDNNWFIRQKLPWNYTPFNGLSDFAPFLTAGIAAGGLFSGADDYKMQAQRDRFDTSPGQGLGGTADASQHPYYHKACDTIRNINIIAYEKMVQEAAFVIESLARQTDLKAWLYPAAAN